MIILESDGPIALGRDYWHDVLGQEVLTDGIAVIALVHHRMRHSGLWRYLGEHRLKDGTLMTLACGEPYRDAGAFIATANVEFGGPAAPRAAQSLCGVSTVFLNAPAAC
jgi:hypothetical protein